MDWFRDTAVSLIGAALIWTVLQSLLPETPASGVTRLVGGVFLGVILLSNVRKADFSALELPVSDFMAQGQACADAGTAGYESELAAIIKDRCHAYILDKAAQMGLELRIQVQLTREEIPVPCGVTLQGEASREAREAIGALLESDLGIPKEAQRWIG